MLANEVLSDRPAEASVAPPASERGAVRLSWVRASEEVPFANLGDALSALIVGAIAGRVVRHAHFDDPGERLVGIGTIVQDQRAGTLHLWGSGMDGRVDPLDTSAERYSVPPDVRFKVHAVRGPRTAAVLRGVGVAVPPVYGDPAWFLPKILPRASFPAPTHELGIVTHISELAELTPASPPDPRWTRYGVAEALASGVRVINTMIEPTLEALIAKVGEIVSCRRILSSSFHGLVIPLAYNVPSLTFGFPGQGFRHVDAADVEALDHRFSDFFQGVGLRRVPVIFGDREAPTADWRALMRIIDAEHAQPGWTGRDLFDAFPAERAVGFDDPVWPIPTAFRRDFVF